MIVPASSGARRRRRRRRSPRRRRRSPAVVLIRASIPHALCNRSNVRLAKPGALQRTISTFMVAITITTDPQSVTHIALIAASKEAARVTTRKSRAEREGGGKFATRHTSFYRNGSHADRPVCSRSSAAVHRARRPPRPELSTRETRGASCAQIRRLRRFAPRHCPREGESRWQMQATQCLLSTSCCCPRHSHATVTALSRH